MAPAMAMLAAAVGGTGLIATGCCRWQQHIDNGDCGGGSSCCLVAAMHAAVVMVAVVVVLAVVSENRQCGGGSKGMLGSIRCSSSALALVVAVALVGPACVQGQQLWQ
jgi:hypothetical protein